MKKLLLGTLLLLSTIGFSQTDTITQETINIQLKSRIDYVKEMNDTTYLLLGNNDIMYYECDDTCTTITLTLTEKFFTNNMGGLSFSKKVRKQTGETLLEQYNYLFLKRGFDTFNVKVEGIELITKKLKLNR